MPIPSQGFFRVYGHSVAQIVSGNFSQTNAGAPPPVATQNEMSAYYLAGIDDPATAPRLHQSFDQGGIWVPAAGDYELQLSQMESIFVFDPYGTPTPVSVLDADFPNGFIANQFRVWLNGNIVTGGRNKYLDNYKFKYGGGGGTVVLNVNPANNIVGDFTLSSDEFGPSTFSNVFWGLFQVIGLRMGFSAHISDVIDAAARTANLRVDQIYIEGVYNTLLHSITYDPLNAGPCGEITINGNNLLGFNNFTVHWYDAELDLPPNITEGVIVPPNYIINHTANTLTIRIPPNVPYGGTHLLIMANQIPETMFIGSVLLAQVNIQLVNGSGVYTLVPGKTNDTYYDRSVSPVDTLDLKIPDPFAKSGFFKS